MHRVRKPQWRSLGQGDRGNRGHERNLAVAPDRVPLESSGRTPETRLRPLRAVPPSETLEATILVRRRPDVMAQERIERVMRGETRPIAREDAAQMLGAAPEDLDRVADFAAAYGLIVVDSIPARRTVKVSGTAARMDAAFGVKLGYEDTAGSAVLTYEGPLSIPASLDQVIVAVLGLDQRPVARR